MKIVNEIRKVEITNVEYIGVELTKKVKFYIEYAARDDGSPIVYLNVFDHDGESLTKIEFIGTLDERLLVHAGDIAIDARLCAFEGSCYAFSQALQELFAPYSKLDFEGGSEEIDITLTIEMPGREIFVISYTHIASHLRHFIKIV
jgi:hypothetical protein